MYDKPHKLDGREGGKEQELLEWIEAGRRNQLKQKRDSHMGNC